MASNSTTYYNLPVFAAADKPKWLVDWNTTMNIIDGAIAAAKAAGDNAQITANANATAITGLNESISTMSTALGTLTTNVTTLTGNVQRINELIGNGTPTTQDKTIIGAINELKARIDALTPGGAVQASAVEYDNTGSGLTADDVQDAIDELNTKIENIPTPTPGETYDFDLTAHTGKFTVILEAGWSVTDGDGGINYALNADKSIGKIYGGGWFSGTEASGNTWTKIATFGGGVLPAIAEAYNIFLGCFASAVGASMTSRNARLHFNTDGTCELQIYALSGQNLGLNVNLPACIYFLKDFGD